MMPAKAHMSRWSQVLTCVPDVLQLSYNTSTDNKCAAPYVKPSCMCTCGFCPVPKRELALADAL